MAETDAKMTHRWTLGRVLPFLMLMIVVMDFALRFVSLERLAFRPNEALRRLHVTPEGPYEPNREYHNDRTYGDLAALGNLPKRRVYRRVDFATDAFGFHNPVSRVESAPAGILLGDSFAIGAEVPEKKALSAQLTELFSERIYNAGGLLPLDLELVRRLAGQLRLQRGVLIYEFLEAHLQERPAIASAQPSWRARLAVRVLGSRGWYRLSGLISSLADSRLKLLAQRLEKEAENDRVLPNRFAGNVVQGRLRNGDWMLFSPSRIETADLADAAVSRWAEFFRRASRELDRDGLGLVVIIIPTKFTVYGPLLASPRVAPVGDIQLGQLERRLRKSEIPVVNVTPAFRAAAAELAEHHEYIYWQDDTHWNECGVSIAAAEFREQIGLQPLPGFIGTESGPVSGSELKTALPSNCGSQQTPPEISTVRSESSQQETLSNNLERGILH